MRNAERRERHDWIDLAKAISILLVVLLHQLHAFKTATWISTPGAAAWIAVNDLFTPVRMPLFFLASGILASASLKRDRMNAFRRRIYPHFYLYAVWGTIFATLMPLVPGWPFVLPRLDTAGLLLLLTLIGISPAWYLWALPIAFYIGWVTQRLDARIVLAAAFALSILPVEYIYSANLLRCMVFFIAGLRINDLAARIESRANGKLLLASSAAFAALSSVTPEAKPYLRPLTELAGVSFVVVGCVLATRASSAVSAAGRWFGKRTLPIYLLHFPIVGLLGFAVLNLLPDSLFDQTALAVFLPPAAVAIAVAGSLMIYTSLMAAGAKWLFVLPDWIGRLTSTFEPTVRDCPAPQRKNLTPPPTAPA